MLGIATLAGCSKPPPEPEPAPPPLGSQGLVLSSWKSASPDLHDRLLLAHALAKGDNEAMVLVATEIGRTPAVAEAIAALGGDVQARFDDVGYLRVRLALDRFSDVSALPDVLMAHLDGGGAHGLYANDRDRVRYPLDDHGSRQPQSISQAASRADVNATDTLLGADIASPATTLAAEIEALLRAAASEESIVLTREEDGGRFPGGGLDLFALMANRAVEVHGKPLLAGAGASGNTEGVTGASSGRRVISVGEIVGAGAGADGTIPAAASLGPAADGAAKPDLLAPGGLDHALRAAEALIATARAQNLPADARHITWALRMGARRLERYQAHEQGFGVIDTTRAIELLQRLQEQKLDLPDIQTQAPVKTYLSRFLPEPGIGQGLYEREGWLVGQKDTRTITLLRQNGAATPISYTLQWQGNDGTFRLTTDEVTLPLNEPVQVQVEIAPRELGAHSAHLYLLDRSSGLPVHAVMMTVVAAQPFTAANGYRIAHEHQKLSDTVPMRHFVDVTPNIASLRVDASVGSGQVHLKLVGGAPDQSPARILSAGQRAVLLVPYPPPGVYELIVMPANGQAQNVRIAASTRYVDSQLDEKPPANNATTLWMNNIYAPLQRSCILTEVGARRVLKDVGGLNGMRAYNIFVEPDSSSLRVAVSPPDGRTRVGIYLYDCVSGTCKLWGSDVLAKPVSKALVVPKPRAGLWRVVVDATAPGTAFEYTEIVTHPRFGTGRVEGESEERRTGARWNQNVSYQVAAPAPFGRELVGVMDVLDLGSETDERAAPFIDWQATGDRRNEPLRPLRLSTHVISLQ
jgi:hypothetical protein